MLYREQQVSSQAPHNTISTPATVNSRAVMPKQLLLCCLPL